ncbi:phosphotransferase [Photobacterium leiognathi]|uniref:phosphotransferase n=1 Tax=Photobacterium leiognathi TaxID=553611 RepID=UPI000D154378|nr:phosphotransferase [Photobacterium leiognathi]PSW44273.1 phosphotransferase [Photobacterium leiognathi subsp. mandapamensis]
MNKAQLKNIAEKSFFAMFHRKADVCDIQETFYGWVVFLATGKAKIVVKFSREVGRISKEVSCLQKLRSIVSCPVPQIYLFGREEGYDYIVLDWLEGRPANELPNDKFAIETFREDYTDILIALHEHNHPQGFELTNGKFDCDFNNAFDDWMEGVYKYLSCAVSPFSAQLKDKYTELWERRREILAPIANESSSFVHDDCHLANVLFDPKTFKVAGLLDPCDSGFKHRELDVIHLFDVRGDTHIAERYIEKRQLDDGFEARRYFFSLWDDAKHSRNMGWYDENWLTNKFNKFESAIRMQ